jgi:hypothetical protein
MDAHRPFDTSVLVVIKVTVTVFTSLQGETGMEWMIAVLNAALATVKA